MPKKKAIIIKHCGECPLFDLDDESQGFCKSSSKVPEKGFVGTFLDVSGKSIIPDWCPLDDFDYLVEWEQKGG